VLTPLPSASACWDILKFNVLTFKDFASSSDVEGRLAVGEDAYLDNGFSVGDKLNLPNCKGPGW
jgi:choice-of-anchor A domain-containing protein